MNSVQSEIQDRKRRIGENKQTIAKIMVEREKSDCSNGEELMRQAALSPRTANGRSNTLGLLQRGNDLRLRGDRRIVG